MAQMGRPKKQVDPTQLKNLMRLKPTLEDTAAFLVEYENTLQV